MATVRRVCWWTRRTWRTKSTSHRTDVGSRSTPTSRGAGRFYVAAFPTFTSKRQISSGGGVQPQWRGDGRELFYLAPDGSVMSAGVDTRTEFTAKPPVRLFTAGIAAKEGTPQYGVTADGQRFLALERVGGATSFTFLLNWLNDVSSTATRAVQ